MNFRFSMSHSQLSPQSKIQNLKSKIADYGRLIRFSHTVFALPFALASVALAWPSHPVTLHGIFWILIALIGARSAAMAFNRLVDRKFDALNPRTEKWELPQGTVKVWEAVILTATSSAVFVYAAYQLNFVCFVLSPVALAIVFFYSLTKRFTWASHLFLGPSSFSRSYGSVVSRRRRNPSIYATLATPIFLGLAVLFWLAGFDVIYSLQDHAFDRKEGLYSIPVRFGVAYALRFSGLFHACTVVFLAAVGFSAQLGVIYWLGFVDHCHNLISGNTVWLLPPTFHASIAPSLILTPM